MDKKVGPRTRQLAAECKETVEEEARESAQRDADAKQVRLLTSTCHDTYGRAGFVKPALTLTLRSNSNRVPTPPRPRRSTEAPITYYSHCALNLGSIHFKATNITNTNNIFSRGSHFSQGE